MTTGCATWDIMGNFIENGFSSVVESQALRLRWGMKAGTRNETESRNYYDFDKFARGRGND